MAEENKAPEAPKAPAKKQTKLACTVPVDGSASEAQKGQGEVKGKKPTVLAATKL